MNKKRIESNYSIQDKVFTGEDKEETDSLHSQPSPYVKTFMKKSSRNTVTGTYKDKGPSHNPQLLRTSNDGFSMPLLNFKKVTKQ